MSWPVFSLYIYHHLYHWTIDRLSIRSSTLLLYITELLIGYRSDHLHSSSISLNYWSVIDLITYTPPLYHWAIDRLSIWSLTLLLYITELLIGYGTWSPTLLLYITELLISYRSDHLHFLYITELLISYRSDHLHSSSISLSYWSVMDLITFTPSLCHWAIDRLSIWSNTLLYITELLIGYQSDHLHSSSYLTELLISYGSDHLHSSSTSLNYWSVIDLITYTPPLYHWTIDRLSIWSPTLLLYITELLIGYRSDHLLLLLLYHCWLVRVSLFIELGGPHSFGKGWWGALGTFMISRPI